MPIYEYKCQDCGTISEILVRNTENRRSLNCPDCNSSNMNKLVSAPGAVMSKGSPSADVPPINCPNANTCGVSPSSCPAANRFG